MHCWRREQSRGRPEAMAAEDCSHGPCSQKKTATAALCAPEKRHTDSSNLLPGTMLKRINRPAMLSLSDSSSAHRQFIFGRKTATCRDHRLRFAGAHYLPVVEAITHRSVIWADYHSQFMTANKTVDNHNHTHTEEGGSD